MTEDEHVLIATESDVILARELGRRVGKNIGFPNADLTRIVVAISEIARNIIFFAKDGEITIHTITKENRYGIEIKAQDWGPGISDIPLAMSDGYSTLKRRGLGLPGARRLMDEFWIASSQGNGTTVTMRKWMMRNE